MLSYSSRVVATEEENKLLKIDMSELKARHKVELEQAQKKMEKEMEQVHERLATVADVLVLYFSLCVNLSINTE